MFSTIVEKGYYKRMRRRSLKENLSNKYREQLASASPKEKKALLMQIETEVEKTLNEEMKKWHPSRPEVPPELSMVQFWLVIFIVLLVSLATAAWLSLVF
jgi:hypothetical protein